MRISLNFWSSLSDHWHQLSDGTRDNIIGGLILAAVLGIFGLLLKFGKRILNVVGGFLKPEHVPVNPQQEVKLKIEVVPTSLVLPPPVPAGALQTPRLPVIPRPPAFGFVARRDSEGRDIVERLKEDLTPHRHQIVELSGPGGVGKTTLAAETVRAMSEGFSRRIVWASAIGRDDFALSSLLDEIVTQLGYPEIRLLAPEEKAEEVQALIATAPALIILDNFETISEAEQRRCVEFLQNRASCPALITTRQKIASDSARNITIPVMSHDEANDFLQRLIEQAIDSSSFAQLDRDRIMRASERNPLVMQWVMGQIDLAQDADTVLDELSHGVGDAAQRVFDRSYGLEQLGDDGRATLLALSLFAPDASRAALSEVAGFRQNVKRLNEAVKRLASLSLVKRATASSRLTVEGLTRELAKAGLAKDQCADEFRRRFVAYFTGHAEAHPKPTPEDYDTLEPDKDDLIIATDFALSLNDWESAWRLVNIIADPVSGLLSVHGYWDDAIRLNEQALKAAHRSGSKPDIAVFSHNLGVMLEDRGSLDEARLLYSESLEIEKKLGNQKGIAISLHQLAMLVQNQGELDEARRLYSESLEIRKTIDDQSGIAASLHQLAMLADEQGDPVEARRLYQESLQIDTTLGNQSGIATSFQELGRLAQDHGEFLEAHRLYSESLTINKRLGDQGGIAYSLHQLATLAQEGDELDEATHLYNQSLEINRKLGDQSAIANSLHQLSGLAQSRGELVEALRLCNESLEISRRLGNQSGVAISLHQLGTLHLVEGHYAVSEGLLQESLDILKKLGDRQNYAQCVESMGKLRVAQGQLETAEALFAEALEIAVTLGIQFRIGSVKHSLGLLAERRDDKGRAARLLREALPILENLHSPKAEEALRDLERVEGKS